MVLFDWLKNRSRSPKPDMKSGKSASSNSRSQAHGKFRLEPLEPRVLLSGDSVVAVVANPALLTAQAKAGNDDAQAVVQQIDNVASAHSSAADNGAVAESATGSKPAVAWSGSWQVGAPSDSKSDAKSTDGVAAKAEVEASGKTDSSTGQTVQSEPAKALIATQQLASSEDDSDNEASPGGNADDALNTGISTVTQLPRGPPQDAQPSAALIAEESIKNNDISLSDSPSMREGGLFALREAPVLEPALDAQPRAPPTAGDSSTSKPEYLRADSASAATAQNALSSLTDQALAPVFEQAVRNWISAGNNAALASRLADLKVNIADLPDGILGQTVGDTITLDSDAAGHGWFVDATPAESSEFGITIDCGRSIADAGSDAFGRIDLLTVLEHEIGHAVGLGHDAGLAVMRQTLGTGERVLLGNDTLVTRPDGSVAGALDASAAGILAAQDGVDAGPITFTIVNHGGNAAIPDVVVSGAGSADGTYDDIGAIIGRSLAGDKIVLDINVQANWDVTGPDAGILSLAGFSAINFARIGNLTGAGGNRDSFVFEPTGSISGAIDGANGTVVLGSGPAGDPVQPATGQSAGNGVIRVGGANSAERVEIGNAGSTTVLNQPLVISNPAAGGEVFVRGNIVATGNAGLSIFGSGHTTTIGGGTVTTTPPGSVVPVPTATDQSGTTTIAVAGNLTISDAVVLSGNASITSTGGNIVVTNPGTINGSVANVNSLTLTTTGTGTVTLDGAIGATAALKDLIIVSAGDVVIAGPISLSGRLSIVSATGKITLGGAVNAAGNILLQAAGAVQFGGAVSGSEVTVIGAAINQNANLTAASGTLDLSATSGNLTMASTAVLQTAGQNIHIAAVGNIALGQVDARVATDRAGATITSQATWGSVSVSATGSIAGTNNSGNDIFAKALRLTAGGGVGSFGLDLLGLAEGPVRIEAATVSAKAGNSGVNLLEATDVTVDVVAPVTYNRVQADGTVLAGKDAALQSDLTASGGGRVVLQTTNGNLTVNPGLASPLSFSNVTSAGAGAKAHGVIGLAAAKSALVLTASAVGEAFNGVNVVFNATLPSPGTESAVYASGTLTITIKAGVGGSTALQVMQAINNEATHAFSAALDTSSPGNDGSGVFSAGTSSAVTFGGVNAVLASGILHIAGSNNDLKLTAKGPGADFNAVQVVFVDTVAKGAESATYDDKTRTLTVSVKLGTGGSSAAQIVTAISLTSQFTAALDTSLEANDGTGALPTQDFGSTIGGGVTAVNAFGWVRPATSNTALLLTATQPGPAFNGVKVVFSDIRASVVLAPGGANSAIKFTAQFGGATYDGVTVEYVNDGSVVAGSETATYDSSAKKLTFKIKAGTTRANQIIAALNRSGAPFVAQLDGGGNNGTGILNASVSSGMVLAAASAAYEPSVKTLTVNVLAATTANDVIALIAGTGQFIAELDKSVDTANNGTGTYGDLVFDNVTASGVTERAASASVDAAGDNNTLNFIARSNTGLGTYTAGDILHVTAGGSDGKVSRGRVAVAGPNNDLLLVATGAGAKFNGLTVVFKIAASLGAAYDAVTNTLTVSILSGTTANQVVSAINGMLPQTFTAALDFSAEPNSGLGTFVAGAFNNATSGGSDGIAASGEIHPGTAAGNDDLLLTATQAGIALNDLKVTLTDSVAKGAEFATYAGGTLTVAIKAGVGGSTALDLIAAINKAHAASAVNMPFSAALAGGSVYNQVRIVFADTAPTAAPTVEYNPLSRELVVNLKAGAVGTTAQQIAALFAPASKIPFTVVASGNGSGLYPLNNPAVSAEGTGDVLLQAQGAGKDLNINAKIAAGGGNISLLAARNVVQAGEEVVTAGSRGSVDIEATAGTITMANGASVETQAANIRLRAAGNIVLDVLDARALADRAGGMLLNQIGWGSISVVSSAGQIADVAPDDTNLFAAAARLEGAAGVGQLGGTDNAIDTEVITIAARAAAGGIQLLDSTRIVVGTVDSVTVQRVQSTSTLTNTQQDAAALSDLVTTAANAPITLRTVDGSIVVNDGTSPADGIGVNANGSGAVLIQSQGGGRDVQLNAQVKSGSGAVTVRASGVLTQAASPAGDLVTSGLKTTESLNTAPLGLAGVVLTGQMDWIDQGPDFSTQGQVLGLDEQGNPVSGAIQAIAIDPTNAAVVYIASVNGGIWKTNNINATRLVEPSSTGKSAAPVVKSTTTGFTVESLSGDDGSGTVTAGAKGTINGGSATARAALTIAASGGNNGLVFKARDLGDTLNGWVVEFTDGATAGTETAVYDGVLKKITVNIASGVTTAAQVIAAVNGSGKLTGRSAFAVRSPDGDNATGTFVAGTFDMVMTATGTATVLAEGKLDASGGGNNGLVFKASDFGDRFNGWKLVFADTLTAAGSESADYDFTGKILTIKIKAGAGGSTAAQVIAALGGVGSSAQQVIKVLGGTGAPGSLTASGVFVVTTSAPAGTFTAKTTAAFTAGGDDVSAKATGTTDTLTFTAALFGVQFNGWKVTFADTLSAAGAETVSYDFTAKVITINIKAGVSTGAQVVTAFGKPATLVNSTVFTVTAPADDNQGGRFVTRTVQNVTANGTSTVQADGTIAANRTGNNGLVFKAVSTGSQYNGWKVIFADDLATAPGAEKAVYDFATKTLTINLKAGTGPTAAQVTGAGVYRYKIVFLDATGIQSNASVAFPTDGVNLDSGQNTVALLNLPVGPAGTIKRLIYRSENGGSLYRLLGEIANNDAKQSFVDTKRDSQLGDGREIEVPYPVWTHLTDDFPSLSMGALAFDPSDSNILYAGTGGSSSSWKSGPAIGLLKTTDGGKTFQVLGQEDLKDLRIRQIITDNFAARAGSEAVSYDAVSKTLTIRLQPGVSTAQQVIDAVNHADLPFLAGLDTSSANTGAGTFAAGSLTIATITAGQDASFATGVLIPGNQNQGNDLLSLFSSGNNELSFTATRTGAALNGLKVTFADTVAKGSETASYDPDLKVLTVNLKAGIGGSTANDIIAVLRRVANLPFSVALYTSDSIPINDGQGTFAAGSFSDITKKGADATYASFKVTSSSGSNNALVFTARAKGAAFAKLAVAIKDKINEVAVATMTIGTNGGIFVSRDGGLSWQALSGDGVVPRDISLATGNTNAVVLGDVNGDNRPDLIVGNAGQKLQLFLNNGTADPFKNVIQPDGSVLAGKVQDIGAGTDTTTALALGDVNGDGKLDLIVGNNGQTNKLYLNSGTATPFSAADDIDTTAYPTTSVLLTDVNGDKKLDLIVGNNGQSNRLYLNAFNATTPTPAFSGTGVAVDSTAFTTTALAAGDFNGDGRIDLVIGNNGAASRLYVNGGPAFTATADAPANGQYAGDVSFSAALNGGGAVAVTLTAAAQNDNTNRTDLVADLNQALATAGLSAKLTFELSGNKLRLRAIDSAVYSVTLSANTVPDLPLTADALFANATSKALSTAAATSAVAVGDLNGDGKPDVVVGNSTGTNRYFLNNGTADPFNAVAGKDLSADAGTTKAIALADANGDGRLDVVAGNDGQASRLYLNSGNVADPFAGVTGHDIVGADTRATRAIAFADLNGDSRPDLVTGNFNQTNRLYLNTGTADPFKKPSGLPVGYVTDLVRAADSTAASGQSYYAGVIAQGGTGAYVVASSISVTRGEAQQYLAFSLSSLDPQDWAALANKRAFSLTVGGLTKTVTPDFTGVTDIAGIIAKFQEAIDAPGAFGTDYGPGAINVQRSGSTFFFVNTLKRYLVIEGLTDAVVAGVSARTSLVGPQASGVYRSQDGGATWTQVAGGALAELAPFRNAGRIVLSASATAGSGGQVVLYAALADGITYSGQNMYGGKMSALYRSDDLGATWRFVMESPQSRELQTTSGSMVQSAVVTVTVAGADASNAANWRALGSTNRFEVSIGGLGNFILAPNFTTGVPAANATMNDVATTLQNALNAANAFGPGAVTVTWDAANARFVFVSNTLGAIVVKAPGAGQSLFANTLAAARLGVLGDVRDVTQYDRVAVTAAGADIEDPASWKRLGNTTQFAANGQYISPNFGAVVTFDDVVAAIQTALNSALANPNRLTVTWDSGNRQFLFRSVDSTKTASVFSPTTQPGKTSLFSSSLNVRFATATKGNDYNKQLQATLSPSGVEVDFTDPAKWRALGTTQTFRALIGDRAFFVTPDFTSVPAGPTAKMADVATAIQTALNAVDRFGAGATTVSWDAVAKLFRIYSNNLRPIQDISDLGVVAAGKASIFAAATVGFSTFRSLTDFDLLQTYLPATSIAVSQPDATLWSALGATRSFSITVNGATRNVTPNFTGVVSMTQVATKFQEALLGVFPGSSVGVIFNAYFGRLIFVASGNDPNKGVANIAAPDARLSAIPVSNSSLIQASSAGFAEGVPLGSGTNTANLLATSDDPALWKALGNGGRFGLELAGAGALFDISPDFGAVANMADVATAIQTAIAAIYAPGSWGNTTVAYDAATHKFTITNAFPVNVTLGPPNTGSTLFRANATYLVTDSLRQPESYNGLHWNGLQAGAQFAMTVNPTNPDIIYLLGSLQNPAIIKGSLSPNSTDVTDYIARLFRVDTRPGQPAAGQQQLVGNGAQIAAGDTRLAAGDTPNGALGTLKPVLTGPHADGRALVISSDGTLYDANDGGLMRLVGYDSASGTQRRWESVNGNLSITEFGSLVLDPLNNVLLGGTQDVGSQEQKGPGGDWVSINLGDGNFQLTAVIGNPGEPASGGGANAAVTGTEQTVRYSGGNNFGGIARRTFDDQNTLIKTETVQLASANGQPAKSGLDDKDKAITGFVHLSAAINAITPTSLVIGFNGLYESANQGDVITDITPGGANASIGEVHALAYGGRAADGTAMPEVIYMAAGDKIYVRESKALGWVATRQQTPLAGEDIVDIVVDAKNWKVAYAVSLKHVFATVDGGLSWTDVTGPVARNGGMPEGGTFGAVEIVKAPGADLRITNRDGVTYDIDLSGALTLGDVKAMIEAQTSKGIEVTFDSLNKKLVLTDKASATQLSNFKVEGIGQSFAALDLGLVAAGGNAGVVASNTVRSVAAGTITGDAIAVALGKTFDANLRLSDLRPTPPAGLQSGIRIGGVSADVLLIGTSLGVYRAFNPVGAPSSSVAPAITLVSKPTVNFVLPGANNDLIFTTQLGGAIFNGVTISFVDNQLGLGANETVAWDPVRQTLVFSVNAGTTALRVKQVLAADPVAGVVFSVELKESNVAHDGSGLVRAGVAPERAISGTLRGGLDNFAWTRYGNLLPNAQITDLDYTPAFRDNAGNLIGDVLIAGTRGRGAWKIEGAVESLSTRPELIITGQGGAADKILLALNEDNPRLLDVFFDDTLKGSFVGSPGTELEFAL